MLERAEGPSGEHRGHAALVDIRDARPERNPDAGQHADGDAHLVAPRQEPDRRAEAMPDAAERFGRRRRVAKGAGDAAQDASPWSTRPRCRRQPRS